MIEIRHITQYSTWCILKNQQSTFTVFFLFLFSFSFPFPFILLSLLPLTPFLPCHPSPLLSSLFLFSHFYSLLLIFLFFIFIIFIIFIILLSSIPFYNKGILKNTQLICPKVRNYNYLQLCNSDKQYAFLINLFDSRHYESTYIH